uniref:Uncharacterized protein n=1 Tax=Setaria viridis TaxID=4556 RepID=A0A4U6UTS4_SETVI|nr:hypothetical protein SEVIR_4G057602v2 [Setaria viridis]
MFLPFFFFGFFEAFSWEFSSFVFEPNLARVVGGNMLLGSLGATLV